MSHVTKLSLAVVLALVAAALNAMWLSAEKRPTTYVASGVDLPVGQEISDEMLAAVPVPGDAEALRASLVPYANRAILLGLTTSRAYTRGDMFFQRDIQAPLQLPEYEVLGPFRLISVGERFKESGSESDDGRFSQGGNNVTIAVDANFDERTRRLLQTIDPKQNANRDRSAARIIAVQVIPEETQSAKPVGSDKNVVYQTVSLQGIENVPRVLLEGALIRFVVPVDNSL